MIADANRNALLLLRRRPCFSTSLRLPYTLLLPRNQDSIEAYTQVNYNNKRTTLSAHHTQPNEAKRDLNCAIVRSISIQCHTNLLTVIILKVINYHFDLLQLYAEGSIYKTCNCKLESWKPRARDMTRLQLIACAWFVSVCVFTLFAYD